MIRNWYVRECFQDLDFLDLLADHPHCHRIFQPFMMDNNVVSEDDFMADLLEEEGIEEGDIYTLCKSVGIFPPYMVPCRIYADIERSAMSDKYPPDRVQYHFESDSSMKRYCIGIGHYQTKTEGKIYMCVLIDLYDRCIGACTYSRFFGPEMTEAAILHVKQAADPYDILIHSSQNKVYQSKAFQFICHELGVVTSMTQKGTRGGIMPVSQFFSGLKRELGAYEFTDVQDAIDWLSAYILKYNLRMCRD